MKPSDVDQLLGDDVLLSQCYKLVDNGKSFQCHFCLGPKQGGTINKDLKSQVRAHLAYSCNNFKLYVNSGQVSTFIAKQANLLQAKPPTSIPTIIEFNKPIAFAYDAENNRIVPAEKNTSLPHLGTFKSIDLDGLDYSVFSRSSTKSIGLRNSNILNQQSSTHQVIDDSLQLSVDNEQAFDSGILISTSPILRKKLRLTDNQSQEQPSLVGGKYGKYSSLVRKDKFTPDECK